MAWYSTDTNATILERPNTQLALHQDLLQCFPTTTKLPELPRCYGAMMDYMQYNYTPQQTTALQCATILERFIAAILLH